MKKEKDTISFRNRKPSVKAVAALSLALVTLVVSVVMVIVSVSASGGGGIVVGILAFLMLLCALAGFVLALKSLYEQDRVPFISVLALILNGLLIVYYLCIYILGFN